MKNIRYWLSFLGTTTEEMDDFDGYIIRDKNGRALFCVYAKPPYNERVSIYESVTDAHGYDLSDEKLICADCIPMYAHAIIYERLAEMDGRPTSRFPMERDEGYRAGYWD